jgi:hypothetical protein
MIDDEDAVILMHRVDDPRCSYSPGLPSMFSHTAPEEVAGRRLDVVEIRHPSPLAERICEEAVLL